MRAPRGAVDLVTTVCNRPLSGAVDLVSTDRNRPDQRARTCESGYDENVPA
jgi:hypothetical protein